MNERQVRRTDHPNFSPVYQPPTPERPQLKRGPRFKLTLWLILVLASVVALLLVGRINSVTVSGIDNSSVLTQQAKTLLGNFSQRYIYWFSADQLQTRLLNQNTNSLADVAVSLNYFKRQVQITVEARQPVMRWQSNNQTWLVDQKGVAASQVISVGEPTNFPLVVDSTNLEVKPGQAVAPPAFISFVLVVQAKLPQVAKLTYQKGRVLQTTNELYVDTSAGFYIRFDTTRSVDDQLAEVKAILNHHIHPSLYIDVRLSYKAYYK